MSMNYQLSRIDRAENMVLDVVRNGYARPDEIEGMMKLDNPEDQIAMAGMITNRGAAQMRDLQLEQLRMSIAASQATINAKNQPDPMQALMLSLFDDTDAGVISFDEFVEQRTDGVMGPISPDMYSELEQEYNQAVAAHNPNADKGQRLALLVASGAITPQQADYVRDFIGVTSPQEDAQKGAQRAESVRVAQTVARDIQLAFENIDLAGSENATLIEQIEGRRGSETTIPFLSGIERSRTLKMAREAQPIYNLKTALDSIASNMSMENLNKMRQNSPTGGALGNVSDKQSSLLSDLLGSTKLEQDPDRLGIVLGDLINFQYDVMYGSPEEIQTAFNSGRIDYNKAQEMLAARMTASPEMLGMSRDIVGTRQIRSLQLTPTGELQPIR